MKTKSNFFALIAVAVLFTGCSNSTDALQNIGGHKEDIVVPRPENKNPRDLDNMDRGTDAVFNIGGHKEDIVVPRPE
jgi:PBP1b-binding outer membrane lipoprotein LpoB